MFVSVKNTIVTEEEDIKKESDSPAYYSQKFLPDIGVRFSNEMQTDILQKKLFGTGWETEAEKGMIEKWNQILDRYEGLKAKFSQPYCDSINGFIEQAEIDWYGSEDHAPSVNQFNAIITIKAMLKSALDDLKIEEEVRDLRWENIIPKLREIANKGFITITYRNGLSGGHGAGIEWRLNAEISGSVPESSHGRNDSALRGAQGAVKDVISYHNAQIEEVKQAIDSW